MKRLLQLLFFIILPSCILSQVPQGIQYQAIARDGFGTPLPSTALTVRFTIRDATNAPVYRETHNVITDIFGLFEAVIGGGTPNSGSFTGIDWGSGQHSVDLEIDSGAGFVSIGNTPFQSVPYALYSNTVSDTLWRQNPPHNGISYLDGRVGIGVGEDLDASLHMADTSNVLIGDSLSGSGFKLIYYGAKGAFRVGYLNNPFGGYNYNKFWDYDSVGYYSFAAGQNARAKGFGSFAFGSFGWADGSSSVAFFGNARGNNSFTFGGSSRGRGSITFEGVAEEEGGIAMYGYTGGRYGVSIGGGTTGLGASSSREDYAVAIGWNSDARGQASIALGPSDAFGYNSFSTGWVTEARGNYSSTFGYRTNSYPYASMALGRYNVITGDSASWVNADPIFMIGNGVSNTNRSNAFMIQKNGQTAIGMNSPTGMLNVSDRLGSLNNAGLDVTNASILIGTASDGLAFDANQIEVIGTGLHLNFNSPEDLYLVNGGGSVGIGNSAPATKLDITGTGWQFRLNNTGAGGGDWYMGASQASWAAGGDKFLISPNNGSGNAEFAITGGGLVGVGLTNPSDKFHVYADAGQDAMRVQVGGTTRFRIHDNGGVSIGSNTTTTAAGLYVHAETNINGICRPNTNGAFSLGTPTRRWSIVWAANGTIQTSDLRLKKNIETLDYGLDKVLNMRPVRYDWKAQPDSAQHLGFIAQEMQEVVPEVVQGGEDEDAPLGVKYSELIPVLVKAVQEQQAQIDAQQQEIEKLKAEIKRMRK